MVNKDVLRLDNNLAFANRLESFNVTNEKEQFKFDFDTASDLEQWDFNNNEVVIKNGQLYLTSKQERFQFFLKKIDLPAENIEHIILRTNISGTDHVSIKYVNEQSKRGSVFLDVPSEGEFYEYKINAANSLRRWTGKIESLFFDIVNKSNLPTQMVLDYIYFQTSQELYSQKIGVDLCKLEDHMRKAIYVHNPSKIEFEIYIPPERDWEMSFGAAKYDSKAPVNFNISIEGKGFEDIIFNETLQENKKWLDKKVGLSGYSGQRIKIIFSTHSKEKGSLAFWSNPIIYAVKRKRPNILLYVIDALRPDHLGIYGYKRNTSPHIDALAQKSIYFINTFSQSDWTRPSIASIFTSTYPSTHKIIHTWNLLPNVFMTLAEYLRDEDFLNASFIANLNAGAQANLQQGFDFLYATGNGDDRGFIKKELLPWIDNYKNSNFFIYVHTMEPHEPYDNSPREFYIFPSKEERSESQSKIDLYDAEIRFADDQFYQVIKKLEEHGLLENTLIILTADHGEAFGEHDNYWEHGGSHLYNEVIRVPLIIYHSSLNDYRGAYSENVMSIDIMPTILDFLGEKTRDKYIQGLSLLPLIKNSERSLFEERECFSENIRKLRDTNEPSNHYVSIIRNNYKFIYDYLKKEKKELYDIKIDPHEKTDLFLMKKEIAIQMEARIHQWLKIQADIHDYILLSSEQVRIDERTREQLKSLGYLK